MPESPSFGIDQTRLAMLMAADNDTLARATVEEIGMDPDGGIGGRVAGALRDVLEARERLQYYPGRQRSVEASIVFGMRLLTPTCAQVVLPSAEQEVSHG